MITGILRQFIFPFRSDFEMRNGFRFFAVQIVAIAKHVILGASFIVFV